MKKIISLFILLIFANVAYTWSYHGYQNDRFGYEIKYPDFLNPQGEPERHDGQKFINGSSELTVWGSYSPLTIDESYQYAMDDLKNYKITYSTKKTDSFTISGSDKNKIAYFKTIYQCGVNINLRLFYPKSEIKKWNPIINEITQSFHLNSNACEKS